MINEATGVDFIVTIKNETMSLKSELNEHIIPIIIPKIIAKIKPKLTLKKDVKTLCQKIGSLNNEKRAFIVNEKDGKYTGASITPAAISHTVR